VGLSKFYSYDRSECVRERVNSPLAGNFLTQAFHLEKRPACSRNNHDGRVEASTRRGVWLACLDVTSVQLLADSLLLRREPVLFAPVYACTNFECSNTIQASGEIQGVAEKIYCDTEVTISARMCVFKPYACNFTSSARRRT
jgi:hypothetical protein